MNPTVRNILAVIAGLVGGSIVNMLLVNVGPAVIPPPPGVDTSDVESLRAGMHLFGPQHFIFPFLAHAGGTFAGAYLAARIAATHKARLALVVGVFFLAGGIAAVTMLPTPVWYAVLDLAAAYLPVAWIAGRLADRPAPEPAA